MSACQRFYQPLFAAIMLLALSCSTALAQDGSPAGRGTYVGLFGGGGSFNINNVSQIGTALFPDFAGGPLAVHATGSSGSEGVGLIGLQIGHEWSDISEGGCWGFLPALEFEAFYLAGTQRAHLDNPGTRLPEHEFVDTFPMNNAALMTSAVLSVRTPYEWLRPYFGGGIGITCVSISGADSAQVNPPEPGINHFNSGTNSSRWAFAAQAKVGLRFALTDHAYVFTEYRYLFVDSTNHGFGSTVYPTHAPTTNWRVHFDSMSHHLGIAGIGFSF